MRRSKAVLMAAFLAAACAPEGEGDGRGDGPAARDTATGGAPSPGGEAANPGAGGARPDSIVDTLMVEGMPEPMVLRRVEASAPFPLPFSTYVPASMTAETASSGEGDALRITMAEPTDFTREAAIVVHVHPEGTTREQAVDAARETASAGGAEVEPLERPHAYALASFRFRRPGDPRSRVVGWVEVGEREGRFFRVMVAYPAEMGDGMSPRVGAVLREWRWQPSGDPLAL